jgi:hypothetical protein
VLTDLDPVEGRAARELGFEDLEGELAKAFPRDAPCLDEAYDGFRRCPTAMLQQTDGLAPVAWEEPLSAFPEAVLYREVRWWLAGSAALAVRGLAVAPRDIDVVTDGPGASALGELLASHLVEPVVRSTVPDRRSFAISHSWPSHERW